jgi:fibronectin type 3 domain-containing protein
MGNVINLYWNLTRAEDVAGFNLYRSEEPTGGFKKINSTPILQASYIDSTIVANTVYYYYVTAIDDASPPNESQASEVTYVETSEY